MLAPYRKVLSVAGVPRLFASAVVGRMPQGMSTLAILLLVREATHSYAAAGAAVGANALASAAIAPVQGRLIDRCGRARILVPVAVAQTGVLVLLVSAAHWGAPAGLLILLSALVGALVPSIAPTVRAILREVIDDHGARESAYALESVAQEIIWILGPFLVALVVALTSPSWGLLMLGPICVCGTVLFVRSPLAAQQPVLHEPQSRVSALSSGTLRRLLGPIALTGFGLGAVEVGLPSLALHAGSRSASGVLLALWSVGSMLGGLWFGSRTWRSPLSTRYRMLLVAGVAFTAPLILARSIPAGAFCALVAGLAIAPLFSCQYALVGRTVSEGSETEAFTWVTSALVGGIAAGSAAAGAVISGGGTGAPFALGCLATLAAAVVALASRRRAVQLA
ncbi:MAG: MFS transporter [Solirubrobacteraceae bacterium]